MEISVCDVTEVQDVSRLGIILASRRHNVNLILNKHERIAKELWTG
jgi:hypothetical protein